MREKTLNLLGLMRKANAMAAITDIGFANAFMKSLAAAVPDGYDESAAEIQRRFERADRRKKEAAAHEKNKRIGKRRNNV